MILFVKQMMNEQTENQEKEIDYTFTGDKAAQDFAYELSDEISEESWETLTNDPNKITEFIMLLTENLDYKQTGELIKHLTDLLVESAEV